MSKKSRYIVSLFNTFCEKLMNFLFQVCARREHSEQIQDVSTRQLFVTSTKYVFIGKMGLCAAADPEPRLGDGQRRGAHNHKIYVAPLATRSIFSFW